MSRERLEESISEFRKLLALGKINMDILNRAADIHKAVIEQTELLQHFTKKSAELNEFLQKHHVEPKHLGRNVIDVAMDFIKEQSERVQELEDEFNNVNNLYIETCREIWLVEQDNKRYREALEEIMKIQENHEWNLYGIAYGIAERTLFEVEGDLEWRKK